MFFFFSKETEYETREEKKTEFLFMIILFSVRTFYGAPVFLDWSHTLCRVLVHRTKKDKEINFVTSFKCELVFEY